MLPFLLCLLCLSGSRNRSVRANEENCCASWQQDGLDRPFSIEVDNITSVRGEGIPRRHILSTEPQDHLPIGIKSLYENFLHGLNQSDLAKAYKVAGTKFSQNLKRTFILLEDDYPVVGPVSEVAAGLAELEPPGVALSTTSSRGHGYFTQVFPV